MGDIYRSRHDRWIAGVCGGIAHRFGWNSNLVRLAVIASAIIVPGVSFLLLAAIYIALIFVLPESEVF
jgi:phage shock protein C